MVDDINLIFSSGGLALDWLWKTFMVRNNTTYKDHWQTTLLSMLWTLWLNRNEKVFSDKISNIKQLHFFIMHRSFVWCHVADLLNMNSEIDWFTNPMKASINIHIYKIKEL